jgi:NTP pyrophosphatase (non-canonical NTP hydrolase)
MSITISAAQQQVDDWIKKYGVRYFSELTNMVLLTEEVGELARIMARRYGDQSSKPTDVEVDMADEMADVFFVLICMANQCGINLEEAFANNIRKKTERDVMRHKLNPKL